MQRVGAERPVGLFEYPLEQSEVHPTDFRMLSGHLAVRAFVQVDMCAVGGEFCIESGLVEVVIQRVDLPLQGRMQNRLDREHLTHLVTAQL